MLTITHTSVAARTTRPLRFTLVVSAVLVTAVLLNGAVSHAEAGPASPSADGHEREGSALPRPEAGLATAGAASPSRRLASSPSPRPAYGWPLRPFHRQHPVRGFFGDPRFGSRRGQFHFGVDVSAPNGTPVYATLSGRISIHPLHPETVIITSRSGVAFSYWHVVPTVRAGAYAVAYRTQIGRIQSGARHVHFSEMQGGRYLNPLRPGAMGPFVDRGAPTVRAVEVERNGRRVDPAVLHGSVDLIADVFDETPLPVEPPWDDKPVMPALIQWRLMGSSGPVVRWRTAVDFRRTIPGAEAFDSVYAEGSRQNRANRPGLYRVFLAQRWNTGSVRNGVYRLQVLAADVSGNTTRFGADVRIANTG